MKLNIVYFEDNENWRYTIADIIFWSFRDTINLEIFSDFEQVEKRIIRSNRSIDLLITDLYHSDKARIAKGHDLVDFVTSKLNRPAIVITGETEQVKKTFKNYKVADVFDKGSFSEIEFVNSLAATLNISVKASLNKTESDFAIKEIDYKRNLPSGKVKILLFQNETTNKQWTKVNDLYYLGDIQLVKSRCFKVLEFAAKEGVNLVVLPELSIPEALVSDIVSWSKGRHEMIIVAGSHYKHEAEGAFAKCPIIHNGNFVLTEKINPSPNELSAVGKNGLQRGKEIVYFKNTFIGSFFVLICSDNLKLTETRLRCLNYEPDFIVVPAFQKDSSDYFTGMSDTVNNSHDLYYIYVNNKIENGADGRTAFFGVVNSLSVKQLTDNDITDFEPKGKLCELKEGENYCLIEADMANKRPPSKRKVGDEPNVIIETGFLSL